MLFLLLNAVGVAIQCASMFPLISAMLLGDGASRMQAFSAAQLEGLAYLSINVYKTGFVTAQLFFGTWLFPLGYLVYKSGFLPRFLGVLLMLDGVAVLIWFLQALLLPAHPAISYPGLAVSFVAEVGLALWLLVKGVKVVEALPPLRSLDHVGGACPLSRQGTEFLNRLRDRHGTAKPQDLVTPRSERHFDARARLVRVEPCRPLPDRADVAEDLKPHASDQPLRLKQPAVSANVAPDQNPKGGIEPHDAVRCGEERRHPPEEAAFRHETRTRQYLRHQLVTVRHRPHGPPFVHERHGIELVMGYVEVRRQTAGKGRLSCAGQPDDVDLDHGCGER